MALPADLRHLLFNTGSLLLWEKVAAFLPRSFWLQRYGIAQLPENRNQHLTQAEQRLKIATFAGDVGYSNQCFLPAEICLQMAAGQHTHAVFLDVLHRFGLAKPKEAQNTLSPNSDDYLYTFLAILQRDDYVEMAWLLATELLPMTETQIVIVAWELLLHISLSEAMLALLSNYCRDELTAYHSNDFFNFFDGYTTARNSTNFNIRPATINKADVYCLGYVIGGGRHAAFIREHLPQKFAVFNIPGVTELLDVTENILLHNLVTVEIRKLPRDGVRTFPFTAPTVFIPLVELRRRAEELLTLLPEIYADSPQRQRYLLYLRFILAPDAKYTDQEYEMLSTDVFVIFGFYHDPDTLSHFYDYSGNGYYAQKPVQNALQILQRPYEQGEKKDYRDTMTVRAMLPTLAWRKGLLTVLRNNDRPYAIPGDELNLIRGGLAGHTVTGQVTRIDSSYVLQLLLPELKVPAEFFANYFTARANRLNLDHIVRSRYERETWHALGVEIPAGTTIDPDAAVHQRVEEYLTGL